MNGGVMIKVLREAGADAALALPDYASAGAAGADLRANLPAGQRDTGLLLRPGARILVPTGLRFEIPAGFEVQVRPRSGLALNHGVTVLNALGTIDSDYRGPVGVVLVNLGAADFVITHGMRIAQAVVAPVVQARFEPVVALGVTVRGAGGFGSTGLA